ncbi:MAG: hypothetical protein GWM90_02810, partial [Gemmatimonadetes bacterium]|nr:hypothetical protein [Gemmatimonadota bacterium]NIX43094.1 hypothetical protein [Gemmatimonadota bacterium]
MMYDLTFLASGFRQHVFVSTDGDEEWVYKIPAAFGRVLPYRHRTGKTRPVQPVKRALHAAAILFPASVYGAVRSAYRRIGRRPVLRWIAPPLAGLLAGFDRVRVVRDAGLAAYQRWARARDFREMLDTLELLAARGLGDLLLPFEIVREAEARLRIDDRVLPYRGPLLVQRRAVFQEVGGDYDAFDWNVIVETQHRLWREGVALTEPGEIMGTRSWALVGRRPTIADTSSLTRDSGLARRCVADETLDRREAVVRRRLAAERPGYDPEPFFRYIRSEINGQRLEALWGRGAEAGRRAERRPVTAAE